MKKIFVFILLVGATLQGCTQTWKITSDGKNLVINSGSDSTIKVKDTGTVVVPVLPLIITNPAPQTVAVGGNASFSFTASGGVGGKTYNWLINGVIVPGANLNSFLLTNLQLSDNGKLISGRVADSAGHVANSANALLSVYSPLYFITQPTPPESSVFVGDSITFTTNVGGATALQWQFSTDNASFYDLPHVDDSNGKTSGENSNTLKIVFRNTSFSFYWRLKATDGTNTIYSNAVHTTPNYRPLVATTQPVSAAIDSGATASFSFVVNGGFGAITYQWKFNGANVGMNSSILTLSGYNVSGDVQCVVTDAAGHSVTSNAVRLDFTGGSGSAQAMTFTFSLDTSSVVSIGIYNAAHELVKTMVSGERMAAGSYSYTWDGKNEQGEVMPDGYYSDSVLSNNINFRWVGGIGNNSLYRTGGSVWSHSNAVAMCFPNNGYGYIFHDITENNSPMEKFLVDHYRERIGAMFNTTYQTNYQLATDGNLVYGATFNPGWYVYAVDPSNDAGTFHFTNGIPLTAGGQGGVLYALDTVAAPSDGSTAISAITGVAVQRTDSLLFIGHLDKLRIYTKGVNAHFLREYPIQASKVVCDYDNNLWVISGYQIRKYIVSAGATLTLDKTITSNTQPLYLDISPDNSTLATIDGYSEQVKFYSNSTGALTGVYGDENGYYVAPNVTNSKLYFTDDRQSYHPFLAYQQNGKLWIGDNGNNRWLRLTASHIYDSTLTWQPQSYYACVDPNNTSRAWMDYREYSVNYSNIDTLTWDLIANYGARRKPSNLAPYFDFGKPTKYLTLSNGHTYCTDLQEYDVAGRQMVEVTDTGFRKTGISFNVAGGSVDNLGNIWGYNYPSSSSNFDIYKTPLIGFDANNNPVYSTVSIYDQIPPDSFKSYYPTSITSLTTRFPDDAYGWYDGEKTNQQYHMAILPHGSHHFSHLTAPSLTQYANSHFPANDGFPGNNVRNYAGGPSLILGNYLINQFRGEGWTGGAALTNIWNIMGRNGLFYSQFGVVTNEATEPAGYGQAANILYGTAFSANNEIWVAHADESSAGKMHFWHGNFRTVKIVGSLLHKVGLPTITYPYKKLMDGLPIETYSVPSGVYGNWKITVPSTAYSFIRTGVSSYLRGDNDLYFGSNDLTGAYSSAERLIGTTTTLTTWKLKGSIAFPDGLSNGINYNHANCYFDVLDTSANGSKIIARVTCSNLDGEGDFHDHGIQFNGVTALRDQYNGVIYPLSTKYVPFEINFDGNNLSFNYNGSIVTAPAAESGANKSFPYKLRMLFTNGGTQSETRIINTGGLIFN